MAETDPEIPSALIDDNFVSEFNALRGYFQQIFGQSSKQKFREEFSRNSDMPYHHEVRQWFSSSTSRNVECPIVDWTGEAILTNYKRLTRRMSRLHAQAAKEDQKDEMEFKPSIEKKEKKEKKVNHKKKEERKRKRIESMEISLASICKDPKKSTKLLILDLNKVLIYRKTRCYAKYYPRPFVQEFLRDLSTKYQMAIWTSVNKRTAKRIVATLFPEDVKCNLLFVWSQVQCTIVAPSPSSKNGKPILMKNLNKVWQEFPYFSEFNTVLLDDSPEKCVSNPSFSMVHPFPFNYSEHSSGSTDCQSDDAELEINGSLWTYLDNLAKFDGSVQEYVTRNERYQSPKSMGCGEEGQGERKEDNRNGSEEEEKEEEEEEEEEEDDDEDDDEEEESGGGGKRGKRNI